MNNTTKRILAAMEAAGLRTPQPPVFAPGTVIQIVHNPAAPLEARYVGEVGGVEVIRSSLEDSIRRWLATMPGVSAGPCVALRAGGTAR